MVVASSVSTVFHEEYIIFGLFGATTGELSFALLGYHVGDVSALALEVVGHCLRLILATAVLVYRFAYYFAEAVGATYGMHGVFVEAQLNLLGIELYVLIVYHTLTVEESDKVSAKILAALEKQLGITLRA